MDVLIAGSRTIFDFGLLVRIAFDSGFPITKIICGCAAGVDRMAAHDSGGKMLYNGDGGLASLRGAGSLHIPVSDEEIRLYGTSGLNGAFCRRDRVMVDQAQAGIFVWDGRSTGTGYTTGYARQRGIPYVLYNTLTGQSVKE